MSDLPICKNCVHIRHYMFSGAHCRRHPNVPDVVHGTVSVNHPACHAERKRSFFDRLFGMDKCGPEGKYFEAAKPHCLIKVKRTRKTALK